MIKATIRFDANEKHFICESGKTLMEILRDGGFFIDTPCGGNGRCGKCAVIASGDLSQLSTAEKNSLSPELIKKGYRLACLARAEGDITVTLPDSHDAVIETDSVGSTFSFAPSVTCNEINGRFEVAFSGKTIGFADNRDSVIGMAVDIGTTTLAARFYNLVTGAAIGTQTALNPQRQYGADVISRIMSCKQFGTEKLHDCLIDTLNSMIDSFCLSQGLSFDNIYHCVIAGNTVMSHIAAGLSPEGMATSPFEPKTLFGYDLSAADTGLNINRGAPVYFAPCLSAFVGGDITAGLLACDFDTLHDPSLFVDIGTNGEIALLRENEIFCCSTAAGPAFEGAHIACGTGCISGAINRVFEQDGQIFFETIGNKEPCGICGSGLIDAVSVLLDCGNLDETGALVDKNSDLKNENYYFGGTGVFITQHDIREMQLAKSAIASGIDTLLHDAGLEACQIANVFIAGGFGTHMDISSACRIGILPGIFSHVAKPVGNTSLTGASNLPLNSESFERIIKITGLCRCVELAGNDYFNQRFIENMLFEPR